MNIAKLSFAIIVLCFFISCSAPYKLSRIEQKIEITQVNPVGEQNYLEVKLSINRDALNSIPDVVPKVNGLEELLQKYFAKYFLADFLTYTPKIYYYGYPPEVKSNENVGNWLSNIQYSRVPRDQLIAEESKKIYFMSNVSTNQFYAEDASGMVVENGKYTFKLKMNEVKNEATFYLKPKFGYTVVNPELYFKQNVTPIIKPEVSEECEIFINHIDLVQKTRSGDLQNEYDMKKVNRELFVTENNVHFKLYNLTSYLVSTLIRGQIIVEVLDAETMMPIQAEIFIKEYNNNIQIKDVTNLFNNSVLANSPKMNDYIQNRIIDYPRKELKLRKCDENGKLWFLTPRINNNPDKIKILVRHPGYKAFEGYISFQNADTVNYTIKLPMAGSKVNVEIVKPQSPTIMKSN